MSSYYIYTVITWSMLLLSMRGGGKNKVQQQNLLAWHARLEEYYATVQCLTQVTLLGITSKRCDFSQRKVTRIREICWPCSLSNVTIIPWPHCPGYQYCKLLLFWLFALLCLFHIHQCPLCCMQIVKQPRQIWLSRMTIKTVYSIGLQISKKYTTQ